MDVSINGQDSIQDGCKVVRSVPELMSLVKSHKAGGFKICFWPQGITLREAFHWVCALAIMYRNIAIFADEAHKYIGRNLTDAQNSVFFESRHSQTRLFYTMFNPRYLLPEMRAQNFKTHIFKSLEENVTTYLTKSGATRDTMEKFHSDDLPEYSYALIDRGKRPVIVSPKAHTAANRGGSKTPKDPAKSKPSAKSGPKGRRSKR